MSASVARMSHMTPRSVMPPNPVLHPDFNAPSHAEIRQLISQMCSLWEGIVTDDRASTYRTCERRTASKARRDGP